MTLLKRTIQATCLFLSLSISPPLFAEATPELIFSCWLPDPDKDVKVYENEYMYFLTYGTPRSSTDAILAQERSKTTTKHKYSSTEKETTEYFEVTFNVDDYSIMVEYSMWQGKRVGAFTVEVDGKEFESHHCVNSSVFFKSTHESE